MQLKPLSYFFTLLPIVIPTLAIGRECCCDRYSQFNIDNKEDIVAHCKKTWANVNAGHSNEDYCESEYCIQQQPFISFKNFGSQAFCVIAGYQCGECVPSIVDAGLSIRGSEGADVCST